MLNIASAARMFGNGHLSTAALRPYIKGGESCIAVNGKSMSTNAVALLQYDEWKDIDRTVIEVATKRLVGIRDLIAKGLVHRLGSIGQTISLWERSSDMTAAQISMSGLNRSERDTQSFDTATVPVPVIHKDFDLNLRRLEASRIFGEGLDTTQSAVAGRVVAEASESMLFSGSAIQVDGGVIYGYLNHPDRNTVAITLSWTNAGKTGANILTNVQAMLAAARADFYFGPYTLYIPGAYEGKLDDDFNPGTSDTRTIRQRIMALEGIAEIVVADQMPADNVVLVQLERDVVDMAIAQDITTVQWDTQGGMQQNFKVMAIWVPRVKSTLDGQSGVVHMS